MPITQATIESAAGGNQESMRNLLYAFMDQFTMLNAATGNNMLAPTTQAQKPQSQPPPAGSISVTGANGAYQVSITPAAQSINATVYHEVSYSPIKSFGQNVVILPVSTANSVSVPNPGQTLYFRFRSSYDQQNWNSYTLAATTPIASGLQSSAASENNTPLNQSNYAFVDSINAGSTANVRVYGAAGPGNSYVGVKGSVETVLPSATIINVAHGSSQIVSWDGEQYQIKPTLPGVFPDSWTPTGKVSVVGTGTPTLPTIVPIISGGQILGYNVTAGGSGATEDYALTLTDVGGGAGATFGAQTIVAGVLISVAPGNPGSGYAGGTTVVASGGVFSGASGGGQSAGGNGGRLTAI